MDGLRRVSIDQQPIASEDLRCEDFLQVVESQEPGILEQRWPNKGFE